MDRSYVAKRLVRIVLLNFYRFAIYIDMITYIDFILKKDKKKKGRMIASSRVLEIHVYRKKHLTQTEKGKGKRKKQKERWRGV